MRAGSWVTLVFSMLAACAGPSLAEDPPRACASSEECVLAPASCCGHCLSSTREDAIALSASGADAYRAAVCGDDDACPACGLIGAAPYAVACENAVCTLRDVEAQPALTRCTVDADCRLRSGRCCDCGPPDVWDRESRIAVRVDSEDAVKEWLCAPGERCDCEPPAAPPGAHCFGDRCAFSPDGDAVTLLFVVDGGRAMQEEQAALAAALPRLVRALASSDLDADGTEDAEPVGRLTVGVITTDMGAGGHTVPTCTEPVLGDDGILRTQGDLTREGCMATYPRLLELSPDAAPEEHVAQFEAHVACVTTVGIGGCGVEQPLEAALKALSPSAPMAWAHAGFVPVGSSDAPEGLDAPFFMGAPHGDRANEWLSTQGSVLAVVLLTDGDDCSIADPALFDPLGLAYPGDLNMRCARYREALRPIARYASGLAQLRDRTNRIVFAPIVGVPIDLVAPSGEPPRWDALVSDDPSVRDDRMEVREHPTASDRMAPSCEDPERGVAYPPERIVQTARALAQRGAHVTVQSQPTRRMNDRRIIGSLTARRRGGRGRPACRRARGARPPRRGHSRWCLRRRRAR